MEKFDLIVIGSGAGALVAAQAARAGRRTALVDQGPMGGTCLNNGCIPSKMLIHPADMIRSIQEAEAVGVHARIDKIDFSMIMRRMHQVVDGGRAHMEETISSRSNLTYYDEKAEFIEDYILKVGSKTITAPQFVIASGSRSLVPPIPGLEESGYLDNVSLLELKEPPKSLIIIGGGYIGCEYGHFFSAMGTEVTILGRGPRLLGNEDPEVSERLHESLSRYCRVLTGHEVLMVERSGKGKVVSAREAKDGQIKQFEGEEVLLAAGRRSNSDLLHPEGTGVETDRGGWIKVDEYLRTSKEGIWALGDATGKHMFRHTANYEARTVAHNILQARDESGWIAADYHAVPYAVFSHPTVAGVGMKEEEAAAKGLKVLVERAKYTDSAKGVAMAEERGFVKMILEEETGKILGARIIGPSAPELIQQVVYLMNTDRQDLATAMSSQIIHPTINEVLGRVFARLERSLVREPLS
ncbi:dihydrolipoyl dehydrogenase [Methanothrix sp.]